MLVSESSQPPGGERRGAPSPRQPDVLRRELLERRSVLLQLRGHRREKGVHAMADRVLLLRVDAEVEESRREAQALTGVMSMSSHLVVRLPRSLPRTGAA